MNDRTSPHADTMQELRGFVAWLRETPMLVCVMCRRLTVRGTVVPQTNGRVHWALVCTCGATVVQSTPWMNPWASGAIFEC